MNRHIRPFRATLIAFAMTFLPNGSTTGAPVCPGTVAENRYAATESCCSQSGLQCNQIAPALQGGRKNVLLAIIDDQSYCFNGFMGGRCVDGSPGERCKGPVCSTAPWLSCEQASDCPPDSCGEATACEPPPGETCTCRDGFCEQCSPSNPCVGGDICVDGQCSPRAPCTGDFVCARGAGQCSSGYCANYDAKPCSQGCAMDETCVGGFCTVPCAGDDDCNDTCDAGLCRNTPAPCTHNLDCDGGDVCSTGETPLRLHDLSCHYRDPGDDNNKEWDHALSRSADPLQPAIVHTPAMDRLASESITFPRARAGGQSCKPARGAIQIGRVQRHRNSILATPTPQGQCRAKFEQGFDEPAGCPTPDQNSSTMDDACSDYEGNCDRWHFIQWWMQSGGITGSLATVDAYTLGVGKLEVDRSFNNVWDKKLHEGATPSDGKFECDDPSPDCKQALDNGQIAKAAILGNQALVTELRGRIDSAGQMTQPLYVYYGPELPHDKNNAHPYFLGLYPDNMGESKNQLAGQTYFDASMEALIDELKRTCVCGPGSDPQNPTPTAESLWDNTVFITTADHGLFLPASKNSGVPSENAHRLSLTLRIPGRDGRVMDETVQAAGFYDILPTVLGFVNNHNVWQADNIDRYPINRSLKAFLDGASGNGTTPFLRNLYYGGLGEKFDDPGGAITDKESHYVVTRGGFLGMCTGNDPLSRRSPHYCTANDDCTRAGETCAKPGLQCVNDRRPCSQDLDCVAPFCTDQGSCSDAASTTCSVDADCLPTCEVSGLCSNDPSRACTEPEDCRTTICQAGYCGGGGPFFDFDGTIPCATDADCVPQGACRPTIVKVYQRTPSGTELSDVFDLNADPDETNDLESAAFGNPGDLSDLENCLREFWTLSDPNDDKSVWRPTEMGCPEAWRQWPLCMGPGNCEG